MSSKTATDMADLVQEWLRIDQVRVNNVLTFGLGAQSRTRMPRIMGPSGKYQIYGLPDTLKS